MSSLSILAAGYRRITNAWADLPLRIKGPAVVAMPVAALLAGVMGFGLALRADHQSDVCLERLTALISAIQDCIAELEIGPCPSAAAFDNKFRSLELLLRDDADQLD